MATCLVERISEKSGIITYSFFPQRTEKQIKQKQEIKNHEQAMLLSIKLLVDKQVGVINDINEIAAIGHRVVQGGETYSSAAVIDESVKKLIRVNIPLAPLHNPANLTGIEVAERLFPGVTNIAVFDTEFHHTLAPQAFLYALPYEYYTRFKVRKYGFHGTSHKYVAKEAAKLMGTALNKINLITLHLGNGCSLCAIEKGECKDTSMGMTPLAGVMMGTRSGDLDPAISKYLMEQTGSNITEIDNVLNTQSGLKGICNQSDMRDIHDAHLNGDEKAGLAIDMFCYQIKKYIGSYSAVLGHVDALVFTAGIGENSPFIRDKICENLDMFGIHIDSIKNENPESKAFSVHSKNSRIQVWIIPTNEEFQIALETQNKVKTQV